jgi:tetratricopeptide (TPR) repeat protein
LSLEDVRRRVIQAGASQDWAAVLRWESLIDELGAGQDQGKIFDVHQTFAWAYGAAKKWGTAGLMRERCAEFCAASKMFSEQVDFLNRAGTASTRAGDYKNALFLHERARDVSKDQGFLSMEFASCSELGHALWQAGRYSDGVDQHRRALKVARSVDDSHDRASLERVALRRLAEALPRNGEHLVEAEALINLLREGGGDNADCRLWEKYFIGILHFARKKIESAAEAFQAVVDIAEKIQH